MPPRKKGADAEVAPKKKPPQDTSPSRSELASELMDTFNKKMKGRAIISKASDLSLPYLTKRLPVGIAQLDIALGGGFPAAGISQIVGRYNSGKSYLVWQVIKQLQYILGDKMMVLFAMTEMRADRNQGRKAGVAVAYSEEDIESFERARMKAGMNKYTPEELEEMRYEIGTIHELHAMSGEDLYDGILHAVDKNVYHLIVIDSIGMIMSAAEAEAESMHEKTYSGAAGVTTQFLHKLTAMLSMKNEFGKTRDTCIIGINQVRDAIGQQGVEYKSPGGRALEHAKFVDLYVSSGTKGWEEVSVFSVNKTKKVMHYDSKEVNWEIKKGKAGIREGTKGSYNYSFITNNADIYSDTVAAGVNNGIIELSGTAYLTLKDFDGNVLLQANGRDKFIKGLVDDATTKATVNDPNTLMNFIRIALFRKNNILIDYDWGD